MQRTTSAMLSMTSNISFMRSSEPEGGGLPNYWDAPSTIEGPDAPAGASLTVFQGTLYGVLTVRGGDDDGKLLWAKYEDDSWSNWQVISDLSKANGRVSCTVLDDMFYILARGLKDNIYVYMTTNFVDWNVRRVGYPAATGHAPAICAFDGKIYAAFVDLDKHLWFMTADKDLSSELGWQKLSDSYQTDSSVELCVYRGVLSYFHADVKRNLIWYCNLAKGTGKWSTLYYVKPKYIRSGVSASVIGDSLYLTYAGSSWKLECLCFNGYSWSDPQSQINSRTDADTGLVGFKGRLFCSYVYDPVIGEKSLTWDSDDDEDLKAGAPYDQGRTKSKGGLRDWMAKAWCF